MRQTVGQRDGAARTIGFGEVVIPGIAVDLQHAMEPLKMLFHMAAAAILGIAVDHRGLRGPLPAPVIHGIAPQSGDPRSPSRAIQYRQRRVVAEHWQQGQAATPGSITPSSRGRCCGSAPMLRVGLRRVGWSCERGLAGSGAGSAGVVETSPRPSDSRAGSASNFSERAPYKARFTVSSMPRNLPFWSRSSTIIPIRMSGSRGRDATSGPCRDATDPRRRFARVQRYPEIIRPVPPWCVHRAASSPCR